MMEAPKIQNHVIQHVKPAQDQPLDNVKVVTQIISEKKSELTVIVSKDISKTEKLQNVLNVTQDVLLVLDLKKRLALS